MERLTKRESANVGGREYVLCNYKKEDCNDSCVYGTDCKWKHKALLKLKEYEDLEEQGKLIILPCKVGDTIYLVDFEEKTWDEATVNSIEVDTRDNRLLINSDYEDGTWSEDSYVFYSKEEAEQALAKMKEV